MYNLPSVNPTINKAQIKIMAESAIAEIGNRGGAIETAELLSKMELLIKEIKSNREFIDFVRTEIGLFGKDYKTPSGTKIELAEVGIKYNYDNCNDSALQELYDQESSIKELVKQREDFLKTIPINGMDIITEHGEVVHIYPPTKTSTSSIKTTIAK
jgi:hypothetical protein